MHIAIKVARPSVGLRTPFCNVDVSWPYTLSYLLIINTINTLESAPVSATYSRRLTEAPPNFWRPKSDLVTTCLSPELICNYKQSHRAVFFTSVARSS